MGRKFDNRLPSMTDEEVASVKEWNLDKESREALAVERRKRGLAAANNARTEAALWKWVTAGIAILGIIVVVLVALF